MAITSVGYDTTEGINEAQWAGLADRLGAAYSVTGAGDWAVTVVPAVDRTVSIAAGVGYGRGVQDTLSPAATVQFPVCASGSRWDTLVLARDWQPPGGTSVLTVRAGTSTQAVSGARLTNPGVTDDQMVALVQITAGQQLPTAIIDLRTWCGKVITANSLLSVPDAPLGTEVVVDGVRYRRELDATMTLAWVRGVVTVQGFTTGVPNGSGVIACPYNVAFKTAPSPVLSNGGTGALILTVSAMRTTGFDAKLYDPAAAVVVGGGTRRLHWSVTGVLA